MELTPVTNCAKHNISSRNIGAHHNARCRDLRSHEPQCTWPCTFFKQSLPTAKNDGVRTYVILVNERCGLQRLNEIAAADDLKVVSGLPLERGDGRNDVTAKHR